MFCFPVLFSFMVMNSPGLRDLTSFTFSLKRSPTRRPLLIPMVKRSKSLGVSERIRCIAAMSSGFLMGSTRSVRPFSGWLGFLFRSVIGAPRQKVLYGIFSGAMPARVGFLPDAQAKSPFSSIQGGKSHAPKFPRRSAYVLHSKHHGATPRA